MMKKALGLFLFLIFFTFSVARVAAQDTAVAFTGEKTAWHEGFDRYDFLMDEQTFALTPIRASAEEKFGAAASPKGKIR